MKKKTLLYVWAMAGLLTFSATQATITIDTVFVGNANNPADGFFGTVSYDYHIGTHEVTNAQYVAFLNAVDPTGTDNLDLYNGFMSTDVRGGIAFNNAASNGSKYTTKTNMADKPVNYVSFWDAARFANWLTNGQGSGGTENGVYDLTTPGGITNNTITRDTTAFNNGGVAIASENEWYKAAYYDGNASYFDYPTQSNTAPTVATADSTGDIDNPATNVANYDGGANWNGSTGGNVTTVGSAGSSSSSHYGTFDQGGNVWEWNESILGATGNLRGLRGGGVGDDDTRLQPTFRGQVSPTSEFNNYGFRVTSLQAIPEPTTVALLALATPLLLKRSRRFSGTNSKS